MSIQNSEQVFNAVFPHIDFELFFNVCIKGALQKTVENSSVILADKNKFLYSEIEFMKKLRLKEVKFSSLNGVTKFKVEAENGNFISLSNLMLPNHDPLGKFLKDALIQLSENNQEMTIYNAINKIIRQPEFMLDVFLNMMALHNNYPEIKQDGKYYRITKDALNNFGNACMDYVEKKKGLQAVSQTSLGILYNFLARMDEMGKREGVLKLAFSGASRDKILSSLIKEIKMSEIRQWALEWINNIFHLADKYPHNSKTLKELAIIAESILNFRTGYPSGIDKSRIVFQIKKFKESLEYAKTLLVSNDTLDFVKSFVFTQPTIEYEIPNPPEILTKETFTLKMLMPMISSESSEEEKRKERMVHG